MPGTHAREKSDAFTSIADIHVANHKRRGNAAKTDPANRIEPAQRILVHTVEHPSQVDKRSNLQNRMGTKEVAFQHAGAQFRICRKEVTVDEPLSAEATQRLPVTNFTSIAAQLAQCPEGRLPTDRHIARRQMASEDQSLTKRQVLARFNAEHRVRDRTEKLLIDDPAPDRQEGPPRWHIK